MTITAVTSPIRVETRQAALDLFRANSALDGVTIRYSQPAGMAVLEAVFFGEADGTAEVPNLKSGRKQYEDHWTDDLWVVAEVEGAEDGYDAALRCQTLFAAVQGIYADDPTLGGLPGLQHATVGEQSSGPNPYPLVADKVGVFGWGAWWRAQISCYARIT
jgi:hypothetical protein